MADLSITHTQPSASSAFSLTIQRESGGALSVVGQYRSPQGAVFTATLSDSQITGAARTRITDVLADAVSFLKNQCGF